MKLDLYLEPLPMGFFINVGWTLVCFGVWFLLDGTFNLFLIMFFGPYVWNIIAYTQMMFYMGKHNGSSDDTD